MQYPCTAFLYLKPRTLFSKNPPGLADFAAEITEKQRAETIVRLFGDCLSARESEILFRRFLIDPDEPETLGHIGKTLNLTPERVRQLEQNALKKLRRKAHDKGLFSSDYF